MNLTLKAAKGNFFDAPAVLKRVAAARVKVLSRQGALVRKIMQRSMRKRKGPAPPGQPPNSHQGNLRKFIFFAYDKAADTVVIGPVKLGGRSDPVPGLLDKGGTVKVKGILNRRGEFVPLRLLPAAARLKVIASGKVVTQKRQLKARPFSQPALEKAKPLLAKEWKGQVKK